MRVGLAIVSALIAYGSLFPFEFVDRGPITHLVPALLHEWSLLSSRGEILGNIALFLPFGLLGSLLARTSSAPAWGHVVCFAAGITLAIACQIAQIYLPARSYALVHPDRYRLLQHGMNPQIAVGLDQKIRSGMSLAQLKDSLTASLACLPDRGDDPPATLCGHRSNEVGAFSVLAANGRSTSW